MFTTRRANTDATQVARRNSAFYLCRNLTSWVVGSGGRKGGDWRGECGGKGCGVEVKKQKKNNNIIRTHGFVALTD